MEVVAELAWLEPMLETGEGDAALATHLSTLRLLAEYAESVRDALYELYCDAADPRLSPLLGPDAPLEHHVRCCYGWCGRVVAMLAGLVQGVRSEAGPDWGLAKKGFRSASLTYVGASPRLRTCRRSPSTPPIPPSRCATCCATSRRSSWPPSSCRARS